MIRKYAFTNLIKLAARFEQKLIALGIKMSITEAKSVLLNTPIEMSSDESPSSVLRKIYKNKAKMYHPDVFKRFYPDKNESWANEKIKKVNEAYDVLKDLTDSQLKTLFMLSPQRDGSTKKPEEKKSERKPEERKPEERKTEDRKPSKPQKSGLFGNLSPEELKRFNKRF